MADPAVCGFLTGLLCTHGGRMELRQLLGLIELPEAELLEVLREAGSDRFVLLDEGGDGGPTVLATTRVRVCRRVVCGGPCEALHLCKLNLQDRCRRDTNFCKYSHEIHSEKNVKILKKHDLSILTKNELAVLLLQSDPFFLPDICKYYKGEHRQDSCSKKTECMKLHICEHFLEGRCSYVPCNRSHNLMDTKVLELLKEEGLTVSVVRNIQDICNEKHTRRNKDIARRRGRSNPKNVGGRSQSRNRYFLGRQGLSPSPSASVGTAHIPEPDKTGPAPLPSSKGKVNQDCGQSKSATPKTVSTQVSQGGTNLSFPVTGHIESYCGSQGDAQRAASRSPPVSADKGAPPAVSSRTSRRVNVLFEEMQTTSVSTSAADHKTATSSLRKHHIHTQVFSSSRAGSVFTSGSSQTPGTLATNQSRAVSPSKSTNAEDFKARVSSTTPSGMEKNDSQKICLDYLSADCKLQSCCKSLHFHLPYRWQVYIFDVWKDMKEMEEIEKAYCDPSISKSHSVDFQKMLFGSCPVRRLSTPSTVQNPVHVLATKWLWYWKNELDQWIEYGRDDGSELTSGDLEFFFVLCSEEFVEFSEGLQKYRLNFNEMIQTNIVSHAKREVRRRPKFVSSVAMYWTQKQETFSQHREQNKKVSFDFPSHWDVLNSSHVGSELFEVSSTSAEYRNIRYHFKSTMKNFDIQKIRRHQNQSLWNNFQRKKSRMLNGGNEKLLFHAADPSCVDVICLYNFDWNFQSLHEATYGKGIYFAKDASSSHSNHKSSSKNRIMFVAQVLVGAFVQGKREYTRPPRDIRTYDSCVDNMTNPSTFVIFDKNQIYPEYIIEYTDVDKSCSIS
ncbi:zinc finger CCCH-type antiviral protein 1 isoform X3 [Trichosurus vulpecula]|uniref:zinc finger CCCH-type antiviral protein 1 isoform X3 n=1 Tax=Trichosurus vulpecula TaxID=9337 RepID=UPI00186B1E44|nr:zinc finger CCCH-type antiviral protein 1 isoform X3 [Trichosurus vulpecula]